MENIGTWCFLKQDFAFALKWLQRARATLSICPADELSARGLETRLAISQSLIRTYLAQGTTQALQDAEGIVVDVETQLGDRPITLQWRLELLQNSPKEEINAQAYATLLRRMIHAFDHSDENFGSLLCHIKELGERASQLACTLIDEFILKMLAPSCKDEHLGKALVRRVWFSAKEEETTSVVKELSTMLNALYRILDEPVSPEVAGAVHSVSLRLLWTTLRGLTKPVDLEEVRRGHSCSQVRGRRHVVRCGPP